ncbi:MAG: glycosyltransferase N-terminal domain-containing protein [Flavipsychrobacter sp.]
MSAIIYWLAIQLYAIVVRIAALFNPKARSFIAGREGLLSTIRYALVNERRPRIWIHCASVGEFEQGRPLIVQLREKYPNYAFVLTFFSPSGYELRKDYEGVDYVFYMPFDGLYNAKKFVKMVKPELAIFVKYELWYFYLRQLAKRGVPTILASAIFRKKQLFFKWYGVLHRRMLHVFEHIFVQDVGSLHLLNSVNIDNVSVSGDTRFDRVINANKQIEFSHDIIESFTADHKVIVAGSTWPADERLLKEVVSKLPRKWRIILVPHEVHDAHIEYIETLFKGNTIRWTEWETRADKDKQVLIVDKMGLLLKLYQFADVAWIGGGVGKTGLHNTLEAAVFGKPIIHGENFSKFKEAKDLIELNASFAVRKATEVIDLLDHWEKDTAAYSLACKNAHSYVLSNAGATATIMDHIAAKKLLTVS